MSAVELTIKGDVEVMRLQPGDTLVVSCDRRMTMEQLDTLRRAVADRFPGHAVVVTDAGVHLSVQRNDAA